MSDPNEILDRRLDRVADEQDAFGLHFFCQIGSNQARYGLTTLQIACSGATLLSWRCGEDNKLFSVQLSDSDHVGLYAILRKHPFWNASPVRRPGEDGEANIHLRFSDQAAGTHSALQFWNTEVDEYAVLKALLKPLFGLMRIIAQDEIPLLEIQRSAS